MRGVSRASRAALGEALSAQKGKPAKTGAELFSVVHLLDDEPRLRRVIADPGVEPDQRARLVEEILGDKVSAPTLELVRAAAAAAWSRPADLVDGLDELAAEALFAAAEKDDRLDDVEDELFRFGRILDREPALRSALIDPSLPRDRKQELLVTLLGGRVHDATRRLVEEAVLHPRGRTIDRAIEEYGRLAAERRARLVATVTSAVPLTEAQIERLEAGLAARLGHPVHLNVEIDPDLVGGVSVRVGDQLFDGSIAHRIADVHRLMAG
jgi:F-type H+-transporting ATPase subunit delta